MPLTSPQWWRSVCEMYPNHLVSLQLIATLLGMGGKE